MNIENLLKENNIPEKAIIELSNKFQALTIKENDFFVQYGEKMNKIGILYEGVLVSRFTNSEGKEVASKFYFLNGNILVVDYYSFINKLKSDEEIQAIENSKLLIIDYDDFKYLIKEYPILQNIIKDFAEQSYLKALDRIRDFQLLNAKERIEKFIKSHKDIINKVMIKDKSSYLGMTRNIYTNNFKKI